MGGFFVCILWFAVQCVTGGPMEVSYVHEELCDRIY